MIITIETIPHKDQRYPTVGDWQWIGPAKSDLAIKVSNMNNPYYEFLVALHELVEVWLCEARGIDEEEVDKFDMEYEANRSLDNMEEPGDDPKAPYHAEHVFAGILERLMAHELGADWEKYEQAIAELG